MMWNRRSSSSRRIRRTGPATSSARASRNTPATFPRSATISPTSIRAWSASLRGWSGRIRIRAIDPSRYEAELAAIHQLSLVSFRDNLLYTPISEEEFSAQYRPILPYVRPELVLLAEKQDRLAGFLFAVPDLLQARRPIDSVVLKTVAVLPGREFAGLGNLLVARCHAVAHSLGFRRVIHALMHESNESLSLSARYAVPFRGYALYARQLVVRG